MSSIDQLVLKANSGDVEAQRELAYHYYDEGYGNLIEAQKWALSAANKGDAASQVLAAELYCDGRLYKDTMPNGKEIVRLLKNAADQGNLAALYLLGMQYDVGRGVAIDPQTAFKLFLRAANLGYPEAQMEVAEIYCRYGNEEAYKQYGEPKDNSTAIKWLTKALQHGDSRVTERARELYYYITGSYLR